MMVTDDEIKQLFKKIKKDYVIDEYDKSINIITDEIELKDETLGGQIAYYRKLKGMKQEELAKEINVCRDIIIFYERNKEYRQINQRTMNNYKKIFKVLEIEDKVKLQGYEKFILTGQAENIKKFCERTGITKKQIANIVNMPYNTISQWSNGRINMSKNKYEKLEEGVSKLGYSLIN